MEREGKPHVASGTSATNTIQVILYLGTEQVHKSDYRHDVEIDDEDAEATAKEVAAAFATDLNIIYGSINWSKYVPADITSMDVVVGEHRFSFPLAVCTRRHVEFLN